MGSIEFHIQSTQVSINPRGYLYEVDAYSYPPGVKCFIGIESIPDILNHFRLGTIFLRNFYTVLDFENNLIVVGVNKIGKASANSERSSITGKVENPFTGRQGGFGFFIVILLILGISGVAYWYYYKYKKGEELKNPFAKTTSVRDSFSKNKET